ncbi:hypothetical protein PMI42_07262 [Bradyrhizobium sp. YR681]|uniref:hypothetical protein n=1 Tax=Bradyrhizobium sp. YR681 TaxID=1144344 RepID=UPI00026F6BE0|nr:hypothetical protein [Bradyrhizobium sp. YR681]EJN08387.1 hypothetical protein PMI42_07262 [Bradyrhizobium sp. YR681]
MRTPKDTLFRGGRIREKHVRIPALRAAAARKGGYISTSDLIRHLEDEFAPTGEDAEILDGRNDTKFSQIVRNLKSHKGTSTNIFKRGLAEEVDDGIRITEAGKKFLTQLRE